MKADFWFARFCLDGTQGHEFQVEGDAQIIDHLRCSELHELPTIGRRGIACHQHFMVSKPALPGVFQEEVCGIWVSYGLNERGREGGNTQRREKREEKQTNQKKKQKRRAKTWNKNKREDLWFSLIANVTSVQVPPIEFRDRHQCR